MAHRGPDDAGYAFFRRGEGRSGEGGYWCGFADAEFRHINEHLPVFDGPYCRDELSKNPFSVALGHRRLAIIDLTHYGHQPMSSPDRRYWITFNGKMYNFRRTARNCAAKGHVFRTRSDTEVILHLWEEHGRECLPMLDGMFAFAIYDRVENVLTLARDRFGVKPLYYGLTGDFLLFASEIKGMLASGLVPPRISPPALVEYFAFQNTLSPQTLFKDVCSCRPASICNGPAARRSAARKPLSRRLSHAIGAGRRAQVAEQVADAFSGPSSGNWSATWTSALSFRRHGQRLDRVRGRAFDPAAADVHRRFRSDQRQRHRTGLRRAELAEKLSYILQTEHYDVVLHAGDMPAAMEKIAWHMDDPRVGMCHQNWYVAKLASRFVKVCLAGAGGDELFGGYPWRYRQGLRDERRASSTRNIRVLAPPAAAGGLPQLFVPELCGTSPRPRESFGRVLATCPAYQAGIEPGRNLLQRALHFEMKTFLHGFLVAEDRISMAHGLETRVPFLDNELADLAWRIPPSLKVTSADMAGRAATARRRPTANTVFRRAMSRYLPEEFTNQPKQASRRRTRTGIAGHRWTTSSRCCSTGGHGAALVRSGFRPQTPGRTFPGPQNHRLLIWSL